MMRHHEHKVKAFSVYAWGAPLVIFITTIILQVTTKSDIYSPNVGKKSCWFQGILKIFHSISTLFCIHSNSRFCERVDLFQWASANFARVKPIFLWNDRHRTVATKKRVKESAAWRRQQGAHPQPQRA